MKRKNKGFTLIELLVVIAIIGLLSTLAVVALNSARAKARDAKRVADVKQVQTALELYFNDAQGYPIDTGTLGTDGTGAAGFNVLCFSLDSDVGKADGFVDASTDCDADTTVYMGLVPEAPTPPGGDVYTYTAAAVDTYTIEFELEGKTGSLDPGPHCATPDGITNIACP